SPAIHQHAMRQEADTRRLREADVGSFIGLPCKDQIAGAAAVNVQSGDHVVAVTQDANVGPGTEGIAWRHNADAISLDRFDVRGYPTAQWACDGQGHAGFAARDRPGGCDLLVAVAA